MLRFAHAHRLTGGAFGSGVHAWAAATRDRYTQATARAQGRRRAVVQLYLCLAVLVLAWYEHARLSYARVAAGVLRWYDRAARASLLALDRAATWIEQVTPLVVACAVRWSSASVAAAVEAGRGGRDWYARSEAQRALARSRARRAAPRVGGYALLAILGVAVALLAQRI